MKKLLLLAVANFLLAAPSAFLAGDLDSPNPYGLTKDEKYIWKNKQNIKKLQNIVNKQQKIIAQQTKDLQNLKLQFVNYKLKVDTLSQQLDGIKTILPNINNISVDITNLKQDLNSTNMVMFALKDEVDKLKIQINKNEKINDNNTNTIISLVENLAKKIDKLKKDIYIQKQKTDFTTWSKSKIFSNAIKNFNNKNYAKAQEMFSYLYEHNYKPATSLFYLGEIEYKYGRYKAALGFYKKSIQKYPKPAKFTPILLYHTGYSLEKLGNKVAAKKSYLKLIHDFPKSIFVKYAKKRLENLEK